jgi:hypothetical protein
MLVARGLPLLAGESGEDARETSSAPATRLGPEKLSAVPRPRLPQSGQQVETNIACSSFRRTASVAKVAARVARPAFDLFERSLATQPAQHDQAGRYPSSEPRGPGNCIEIRPPAAVPQDDAEIPLLQKILFDVAPFALAACLAASASAQTLRPIGTPINGVTVDAIDHLPSIVDALASMSRPVTARIVFDEFVPATDYLTAAKKIHPVSYVMGEILDSFYVKQYTTDAYKARAQEYVDTLGAYVDIWEVGNEINGEWLGDTASVVEKMIGAYDVVKAKDYRAALTLYYNQDCWSRKDHEMFSWTAANVPDRMKQGLDYVLISYYEDDCNGLQPDWKPIFMQLHAMFPNSQIGFGEVGTRRAARKEAYMTRYYSMNIDVPNYIGGYFWWYFKQDAVPKTKPLWNVLNGLLR